MILCTECDGFGKHFSRPLKIDNKIKCLEFICPLCEGTGKIKDKQIAWIIKGKKLRDYRVFEIKMGLRKAAKFLGIDPSNLSKMERGILKPVNLWNRG